MEKLLPTDTEQPGCRPALAEALVHVSDQCSRCQRCVFSCAFLKQYGDPKTIADSFDPSSRLSLQFLYECSLCSHCTAVCPEGVAPQKMFLEMRREAVARGAGDLPEHQGLRRYEQIGTSQRYSWYGLPEGCEIVFFPGCSLTGSRPETTLKTFTQLQSLFPAVGIVLDCCSKPSHDLGDEAGFQARFGEMAACLREHGVKQVITACPNCHVVFREYADDLATRSVYDVLNHHIGQVGANVDGDVVVHDPCVARFDTTSQQAVRDLIKKTGLTVSESHASRELTQCCGKGGGANCTAPEKADAWTTRCLEAANGQHLVSYCASCTKTFSEQVPAHHLLDLLFAPSETLAGRVKGANAPFTYLNRLNLKKRLRRTLDVAVSSERPRRPEDQKKGKGFGKKVLLGLLPIALGLLLLRRGIG